MLCMGYPGRALTTDVQQMPPSCCEYPLNPVLSQQSHSIPSIRFLCDSLLASHPPHISVSVVPRQPKPSHKKSFNLKCTAYIAIIDGACLFVVFN